MKLLFAGAIVVLAAALAITRWSEPEMRSEVPVIYWVIDPAPVRAEHIRLFHLWQLKSGHFSQHRLSSPEDVETFRRRRWSAAMRKAIIEGNDLGAAVLAGTLPAASLPLSLRVPKVEMRLDAASNDMSKKLIQGVSGVAGDVMELYGNGGVQYLASGGLLADLTEDAQRLGFGPEVTYPALAPAITYNGRQYSFPRNPNTTLYWVNKETFARHGQPLPPRRWTFEEFEARGKAFVAAANPPGERRTVFFANWVDIFQVHRSLGLGQFNETMTRCILDDPRCAQAFALIYKWVYEDRLLPSSADLASFATQAGGGAPAGQLFANGNFAMLLSGRYQLMQFRQLEPIELAVVELPHGGFPCSSFSSGQGTVYRGSRHPELAKLFMAFYASEEYSMQIVGDGDGLPPIPRYTQTEAYLRPAEYPNEWGCHEVFADDALHNGIAVSYSPFVQTETVTNLQYQMCGAVLAKRATPADAARELAARVNREIDLTIQESPKLRAQYEQAVKLQARIDAYRRDGRPVPASWIADPFQRRLYQARGWLEESAATVESTTGVSTDGTPPEEWRHD